MASHWQSRDTADRGSGQTWCYLARLPWLASGGGLDWNQLPGTGLDLSALTSVNLTDWLSRTALGEHSHVVFLYADDQPCIACTREFGMANIDRAFLNAPGKRYVFGGHLEAGRIRLIASHFAEYDGCATWWWHRGTGS